MAIKYLCDGCGKEVPYDLVFRAEVAVKFQGGSRAGSDGSYEVCRPCADKLVREANPKNWARMAPPRAAVAR